MPPRSRLRANKPAKLRGVSQKRYDHVESLRHALLDRLARFGEPECTHPSYKGLLVLLNQRFRTASIDQRIAILKAAKWLIGLIEMHSRKP